MRRSHGLHANPFPLFPRVIVSMAWLPRSARPAAAADVYAQATNPKPGKRFAFDILVVDEAHHVAPSSPSRGRPAAAGYAVDTQRTLAVRAARRQVRAPAVPAAPLRTTATRSRSPRCWR